jgi:predicted ester cyclase
MACSSKTEKTSSANANEISSTDQNKDLIKRVFSEMANQRKYALVDSFYAPDIIDHSAFENQQQGREGFKTAVKEFFDMFSALEITLDDMIAEGDQVATRETWKVTMASDKKALNGKTLHIFKIRNGLITDEWSEGWEKWLGAAVVLQPDSSLKK